MRGAGYFLSGKMEGNLTLDQFVDEGIRRGSAAGYHPTVFLRMRQDYGTKQAIERIVKTSKPQSGFRRMKDLGLLEWTLESAVLKFPEQFSSHAGTYAKARLDGTLDA
jgi:hypothetical protein